VKLIVPLPLRRLLFSSNAKNHRLPPSRFFLVSSKTSLISELTWADARTSVLPLVGSIEKPTGTILFHPVGASLAPGTKKNRPQIIAATLGYLGMLSYDRLASFLPPPALTAGRNFALARSSAKASAPFLNSTADSAFEPFKIGLLD